MTQDINDLKKAHNSAREAFYRRLRAVEIELSALLKAIESQHENHYQNALGTLEESGGSLENHNEVSKEYFQVMASLQAGGERFTEAMIHARSAIAFKGDRSSVFSEIKPENFK